VSAVISFSISAFWASLRDWSQAVKARPTVIKKNAYLDKCFHDIWVLGFGYNKLPLK
jgi:hypothetical protein